jgi:3-methylcrotonyl-CoA carboxylase alpha subunit
MTPELRAQMGAAAVEAARAVGYLGAGTVEFIADDTNGLRPDAFWFIEMNTRLQVEHPVTEAVTGLDLVEWQFRVAAGETLPLAQTEVKLNGYAIEARLYAEDPEQGFLPSTGRIVALQLPDDIRVDSGVEAGGEVTPYYDAMIAKLIAHAESREAAVDHLLNALDRTVIAGPRSNVAFLAALCRTAEFRQGTIDTGFIDRNLDTLGAVPHGPDNAAAALGVAHLLDKRAEDAAAEMPAEAQAATALSPWNAKDGFQLGGIRALALPIVVDAGSTAATVTYSADGTRVLVCGAAPATDAQVFEAGDDALVLRHGRQTRLRLADFTAPAAEAGAGDGAVKAPMHGRVLELLVAAGDRVDGGQRLAVIEAMKMEHTLRAPFAGVVTKVPVAIGAQVVEGAEIVVIEPSAAL